MSQRQPSSAASPVVRQLAMPADTNPSGDIFGGWLLAQMDIAGGMVALDRARGRVATVAVEAMTFHKPVHVGDVVSIYADVTRTGRTSITVQVEAFAKRGVTRPDALEEVLVTQGRFVYVAIGPGGLPRPVPEKG